MATELTTDLGLALLINAVATVAALGVLIWTLGPVSGAHFNPAVTMIAALRREISPREAGAYVGAQILGALLGVALANVMFELPAWHLSDTQRVTTGTLLGEVVATAGLLALIGSITRTNHGHLGPVLVPAWIGSAYFFTASTSFANPAVTLGRMFTDTFTGIDPASVLPYIGAQLIGAAVGALLTAFFYSPSAPLDLPDPIHTPEGTR